MLAYAGFHVGDRLELGDEPRIDLAAFMHFLRRHAETQRLGDHAQAIRRRRADGRADGVLVVALTKAGDLDFVEAGEAGLKPAQAFLQRFGEGSADRHDFADRLHGGGQRRLGAGVFSRRQNAGSL